MKISGQHPLQDSSPHSRNPPTILACRGSVYLRFFFEMRRLASCVCKASVALLCLVFYRCKIENQDMRSLRRDRYETIDASGNMKNLDECTSAETVFPCGPVCRSFHWTGSNLCSKHFQPTPQCSELSTALARYHMCVDVRDIRRLCVAAGREPMIMMKMSLTPPPLACFRCKTDTRAQIVRLRQR